MAQKRPLQGEGTAPPSPSAAGQQSAAKRARTDAGAIVPLEAEASATTALIKAQQEPARTSRLQAPIMLLEGHTGPVYTVAVSAEMRSTPHKRQRFSHGVCVAVFDQWAACCKCWQGQEHQCVTGSMCLQRPGAWLLCLGICTAPQRPVQCCGMCMGSAPTLRCCLGTRTHFFNSAGVPPLRECRAELYRNPIYMHPCSGFLSRIAAACADKTVALWDVEAGNKLRTWKGHTAIVNSAACTQSGPMLVVSGSDDGAVRVWDARSRGSVHTHTVSLPTAVPTPLPITAVAFGNASDSDIVYYGSVSGDVVKYNVRAGKPELTLTGHSSIVTGVAVSKSGEQLASHAADGTVRLWDVRPFAGDRSASIMAPASSAAAGASSVHPRQRASLGATAHSAERLLHRVAWAPDGGRVAAGSADETVYVWHTTPDAEVSLQAGAVDPRLQYALPGHAGGVTDVSFSPIEPILASCATDGKVYLGEVKQA